MGKFIVIYKHSCGCLHSVIFECPFVYLSLVAEVDFVESLFSKAYPKCKLIAILPLF